MATYLENLTTTRQQISDRLAEITASPKPSYSVDGESYSWTEYFEALMRQLEAIDAALQRANGPFEIRSQGVT